jgi:hypothetical protein
VSNDAQLLHAVSNWPAALVLIALIAAVAIVLRELIRKL